MSKNKQKKGEEKKSEWREIIIQTNGNEIKLVKSEVSGSIELIAILQGIVKYVGSK